MYLKKMLEYYKLHQTPINGAIIGFSIAVFILLLGILKTLFIAICVGTGYYIGKRISEDRNYITNLLDRILPPGTYR